MIFFSRFLGAFGSTLAAISWFFVKPYEVAVETLTPVEQSWVFQEAGSCLCALGRFAEACPAVRTSAQTSAATEDWSNAAISASLLSSLEVMVGNLDAGIAASKCALNYANRSGEEEQIVFRMVDHADALHAAGKDEDAERLFMDAEKRQREYWPKLPQLHFVKTYEYYDLLLSKRKYAQVRDRANCSLERLVKESAISPRVAVFDLLALGRAHLGMALIHIDERISGLDQCDDVYAAGTRLSEAVDRLRLSGRADELPRALLARAAFRRSVGEWDAVVQDLDEIKEIVELGPMRLFLCGLMLERARLCFARIEAFAPLNGMLEDSPPKPVAPDMAETERLKEEAKANLADARKLIADCGYHRRDEEFAELEVVLAGSRRFAELPHRV